jgi:capsular polysaccharide export protein
MLNRIGSINGRNILLLQGPYGNFFKKLDNVLRENGACTHSVCLNAGDRFFSNKDNIIDFTGKKERWGFFIRQIFVDYKIRKIFLFGDCRYYQRTAIREANELGIECFVFEEGYIRPDFITLEKSGVNAFSSTCRSRSFYDKMNLEDRISPKVLSANIKYSRIVCQTIVYYILMSVLKFRYPYYEHHLKTSCLKEAFYGIRNVFRKIRFKISERNVAKQLQTKFSKKYYFVPLQTHTDFQVRTHSNFDSMEAFIKEVLFSFASHAPKNSFLVFKHHPMDSGRKNYSRFIDRMAVNLRIHSRVLAVHDVHLPTCLKNAIGTVTINSTVGLSSLYHKTPTIALGKALYDIKGLTCKGMRLSDFWNDYKAPDTLFYKKFRLYLIEKTQLNGSFYGWFPTELSVSSTSTLTNSVAEYEKTHLDAKYENNRIQSKLLMKTAA